MKLLLYLGCSIKIKMVPLVLMNFKKFYLIQILKTPSKNISKIKCNNNSNNNKNNNNNSYNHKATLKYHL
jgi:hypothetical protein